MKFIQQLERVHTIDRLIRQERTGTAKELAGHLGVAEVTVYRYIHELKDLGAPIRFSRTMRSYVYKQDFNLYERHREHFSRIIF